MERDRRRALGTIGSALGVALAGCTSELGDGSNRTDTTTGRTTTDTATTNGTTDRTADEPAELPDGVQWAVDVGGAISVPPRYADGTVYVAGENGHVLAVDAASGDEAWRFEAPAQVNGLGMADRSPLLQDGVLYVASGNRDGPHGAEYAVHALDASTGVERWRFAPDARLTFFSVLGVADGTLFVGTNDDALSDDGDVAYGVDVQTGEKRFSHETGDVSGAAFDGASAYVAAQKTAYALSPDGSESWTYSLDDYGTFDVVTDGENVYWGYRPDGLVAIQGGTERWTYGDWFVTSLRLVEGHGLVAGGQHVASLRPDGTERWRYDGGGLVHDAPVSNDTLYCAGRDGLVGVALADGSEAWTADTEYDLTIPETVAGDVVAARAIYERDGSRVQDVHAYAGDGSLAWTLDLQTDVAGLATDGERVFVPSSEGTLYARPA